VSLFKCLLFASLVSQTFPAAYGEAHCPGNVASLTLRFVQNSLIVVPIEINHSRPYDFLVVDNTRHILCLDESGALASTIKGQHIALADPHGSKEDLPFTRPVIVAARLFAGDATPVLLRLDSGSNAPLLYVDVLVQSKSKGKASILKRVANGVEQSFAVLPPQDIQIGTHAVRNVSFVVPRNEIGSGPTPREDGLLPTMAFQRVFITCSGGYVALEPWGH